MGLYKKVLIPLSHWPTVFLIIGYPVFWLELYFFKGHGGHASLLAWAMVLLVLLGLVYGKRDHVSRGWGEMLFALKQSSLPMKAFLCLIGVVMLAIAGIVFYASFLPPHLAQEFDAINYHITMPRQHLMLGSFAHIPWATADLYLLPLDFALAPFWLATELPNKIPQAAFFVGLLGVAARLAGRLSGGSSSRAFWVVCAVLGMHVVGIQAGTAMLDLSLCYLFLAALDSLWEGRWLLSAVEFAFYFWSKSFMPVQMLVLALALALLCAMAQRWGLVLRWGLGAGNPQPGFPTAESLRRWAGLFLVVSLLVGGPFVAKSMYYAGTPLFPFGVGALRPLAPTTDVRFNELQKKAVECLQNKDSYGVGRSPLAFVEHLWLIAVPEKGVNNRFDYPVGMVYLLLLGPFIYYLFHDLRERRLSLLAAWIFLYWGSWWLGSQQTRFLFVPLLLMAVLVLCRLTEISKTLKAGLAVSVLMVLVSVYGAHKADLGKNSYGVLREKDKDLIAQAATQDPSSVVTLDFIDAAFAPFPIRVQKDDSVFVLND